MVIDATNGSASAILQILAAHETLRLFRSNYRPDKAPFARGGVPKETSEEFQPNLRFWNLGTDPRDRIPSGEDLGFLHRIDRLVMFRWFVAAYLVVHIALVRYAPMIPQYSKQQTSFFYLAS